MNSQPKRRKGEDPFKTKAYQDLVKTLKAIMEEAKAKGIDLNQRYDVLSCQSCGCYESFLAENAEKLAVYDFLNKPITREPFIIIDKQERHSRRKNNHHYRTIYTFICTVCGAYQTQIIHEKFTMD